MRSAICDLAHFSMLRPGVSGTWKGSNPMRDIGSLPATGYGCGAQRLKSWGARTPSKSGEMPGITSMPARARVMAMLLWRNEGASS